MAVLYGKFELPEKIVIDFDKENTNKAKFIAEPFERGFAHTIGHSMRRVLLSSLEAPAIISLQIEGVPHEFMAVDGVVEDMTNIILNLKGALLRRLPKDSDSQARDTRELTSTLEITKAELDKAKGSIEVKLGDLVEEGIFEIVNPDHYLFTVTKPLKKQIKFKVAIGRGYLPSERVEVAHRAVGEILMDACFSPVRQVNYSVENTRVGQDTDFDRLIIDIVTDGRITPQEALNFASQINRKHYSVYGELEVEPLDYVSKTEGRDKNHDKLMTELCKRVDEVELSVRSANCLEKADITHMWQLVILAEKDMLNFQNFGKKSLNEIKDKLTDMELSFLMDLSKYGISAENIEEELEKFKKERSAAEFALPGSGEEPITASN